MNQSLLESMYRVDLMEKRPAHAGGKAIYIFPQAFENQTPVGPFWVARPLKENLEVVKVHLIEEYPEKGYLYKKEEVRLEGDTEQEPVMMDSCYSLIDGSYIGDRKDADFLALRGIKPQRAQDRNQVASIGFCQKESKWYGWSHRAIFGFGIGSEVKEGDVCAMSGWCDEYAQAHPELDVTLPVGFVAKTLDDCKRMAVAFADGVS